MTLFYSERTVSSCPPTPRRTQARFRVLAPLDLAGGVQTGTVTIDRKRGLFSVRPLRRRRVYTLPLDVVATLVVQRIVFAENPVARRPRKAAA